VKNARLDKSMELLGQDMDTAAENFEKAFITTPKRAAQVILKAVEHDKPRAMVGPDAHVFDLVARMPPRLYQSVIIRGARRGL
jgi:short-subunit dehydrogenase